MVKLNLISYVNFAIFHSATAPNIIFRLVYFMYFLKASKLLACLKLATNSELGNCTTFTRNGFQRKKQNISVSHYTSSKPLTSLLGTSTEIFLLTLSGTLSLIQERFDMNNGQSRERCRDKGKEEERGQDPKDW